jgi:hypothetical protein
MILVLFHRYEDFNYYKLFVYLANILLPFQNQNNIILLQECNQLFYL